VDNGSSHRGDTAQQRLHPVDARLLLVHTPVHASGRNQVASDVSLIPRQVLTPHDGANLEAIRLRLARDDERSNQRPTPFQGKCDRPQLVTLLAKIEAHQKLLADAPADGTEEAASSGQHF
jgi:hypothetical protein